MNVLNGERRGPPSPRRAEVAYCHCGSAWFELRGGPTTEHLPHGAVCVDGEGAPIGYAGELHCIECGEVWRPSTAHLQAVE